MTESQFRKCFPANCHVPAPLLKLLSFQSRTDGFYSGHFCLIDDGVEALLAWFDHDNQVASTFIAFGREADDALFAFWLYDNGRGLSNAPIVSLGSEGGAVMLANSVEDFLELLAIGSEHLLLSGFEMAKKPAERLGEFRSWLKKELGIVPAKDPAAIADRAEEAHASLSKWMRAWQKSHFG